MEQDFEYSRQKLETRNEAFASLVAALILLGALTNQTLVSIFNLNVERPLPALIFLEGVGSLGGLLAFAWLRRQPPYHWWRKYAFSLINLSLILGLIAALKREMPPDLALLVHVPILMLLLLITGLRYSTRALALAGGLSVVTHIIFVVVSSATSYKVPVLSLGLLLLPAETAILTYLVHSLDRLHRESVAKDRLRRFVSPEVAAEIMRAPDAAMKASEREVTILFCDISGFTTLAQTLPPTEIMAMLNEHFGILAPIIFKHQGTLEKYIGDALMAVWGAPLAHPDDASRAVQAALEMQAGIQQLNGRWQAIGRPAIHIHIGIHSGRVAAGNIGSEAYQQYATIGDTTNIASRICDVTQPGEILLSASTRAKLTENKITLTALPPRLVKGKDEPLELYRVE